MTKHDAITVILKMYIAYIYIYIDRERESERKI